MGKCLSCRNLPRPRSHVLPRAACVRDGSVKLPCPRSGNPGGPASCRASYGLAGPCSLPAGAWNVWEPAGEETEESHENPVRAGPESPSREPTSHSEDDGAPPGASDQGTGQARRGVWKHNPGGWPGGCDEGVPRPQGTSPQSGLVS